MSQICLISTNNNMYTTLFCSCYLSHWAMEFLQMQVRNSDKNNRKKLNQLLKYLIGKIYPKLILCIGNTMVERCYMYTLYTVHVNFKVHTGADIKIGTILMVIMSK